VSIWQPIISLFTTGGRINPIAILLMLGVSFFAYDSIKDRFKQAEIVRQCEVYRGAQQDKLNNLTRSQNEVTKTIQSIDPNDLSDFADRINGMQHKAK